jgi:hypothetical protein
VPSLACAAFLRTVIAEEVLPDGYAAFVEG